MSHHIHKTAVISVGGSLLFTQKEEIDSVFLQKFNTFIRSQVGKGWRFFLVSGGGKICRWYQRAAQAVIHELPPHDLDWLGIHATRLNGHLFRTIFADIAHPRMIENYDHKLENWIEPVVIGAGWKPGWSTDYCAVHIAHDYTADLTINLSNISHICDSDPRVNPDAHAYDQMTWAQVQKLVGTEWKPGMNTPFDPIASQFADRHDLTVAVCHGADLANLGDLLEGKKFTGTLIANHH